MPEFLSIKIGEKKLSIGFDNIGFKEDEITLISTYDDINSHPHLKDGTWNPLRECAGSGGCIIQNKDGKRYSVDFYLSYDTEPHHEGKEHWNFEGYIVEIRKGVKNKTMREIQIPADFKHLPPNDSISLEIGHTDKIVVKKDIKK